MAGADGSCYWIEAIGIWAFAAYRLVKSNEVLMSQAEE
jgi:hypothetical protein